MNRGAQALEGKREGKSSLPSASMMGKRGCDGALTGPKNRE
jgi:hypothetical protein